MAAMQAARSFGLGPDRAALVALDAGADVERLIDALASALVEDGALQVPATPPA